MSHTYFVHCNWRRPSWSKRFALYVCTAVLQCSTTFVLNLWAQQELCIIVGTAIWSHACTLVNNRNEDNDVVIPFIISMIRSHLHAGVLKKSCTRVYSVTCTAYSKWTFWYKTFQNNKLRLTVHVYRLALYTIWDQHVSIVLPPISIISPVGSVIVQVYLTATGISPTWSHKWVREEYMHMWSDDLGVILLSLPPTTTRAAPNMVVALYLYGTSGSVSHTDFCSPLQGEVGDCWVVFAMSTH